MIITLSVIDDRLSKQTKKGYSRSFGRKFLGVGFWGFGVILNLFSNAIKFTDLDFQIDRAQSSKEIEITAEFKISKGPNKR